MAWYNEAPGGGQANKALTFPVGAVSPLWLAFGAATTAGLTYWWMTRWMKPTNLEAAFTMVRTPALEAVQTMEAIVETIEAETEELLEALTPEPAAVVETAPPVVEAAPAPEPTVELVPDDLTVIVGIGPKLSAALAERGVTRFAQIATWAAADLAEVDAALNLKGRAVRDAWVAQAARLAH